MTAAPVPSYAQVRRLRTVAAENADGLEPTGKTIPLMGLVAGRFDVPALEEAVRLVVARHRALHHRFVDEDGRLEYAGAARIRCDVVEASALAADPDGLDAAVMRRVRAAVDRPFDPLGWPLVRVGVIQGDTSVCHVSVDHLVTDAWSQSVLMLEIPARYEAVLAGRADPEPPAADFFAFTAAQRRRFDTGPGLDAPLTALRRSLRGRPLHPPFALDVPWNPDHGRYVRRHLLDPAEVAALTRWCREHRATLFMAVLAAFGIALREVAGPDEVGVLVATHNRDDEVRGVGWYANMLPVYFPVSGEPTGTVGQVRRALVATLEFHELPLARALGCLPAGQGGDEHASCFVSMTDDRTGERSDGPPAAVPADPEAQWRRIPLSPARRRGYGMWISLQDEGMNLATASPAVRGNGTHLDEVETAFAAVLRRMVRAA